jgi:Plasma-membrane choline transporter
MVAFGWSVLWTMAFVGLVHSLDKTASSLTQTCICVLLIASFHWTNTVIKNVVRVTVASAIGTWWFQPNEVTPYCTVAVSRPLGRALTTSFGSICLASLVGQVAQALHLVQRYCCCVESACCTSNRRIQPDKQQEGGQSLIQTWHGRLRSCNRWAYTYIGMYGYCYIEAGEKAIQLFETREWMEIVRDNLIQNVLIMVSLVIGGSAGVFAVVVEETDGYDFAFARPTLIAFCMGSVLGFVLSNILLLGLVGSAVNTVLVCFAAGPFEFDRNHPRLSREMREVWSQQVWEASSPV